MFSAPGYSAHTYEYTELNSNSAKRQRQTDGTVSAAWTQALWFLGRLASRLNPLLQGYAPKVLLMNLARGPSVPTE